MNIANNYSAAKAVENSHDHLDRAEAHLNRPAARMSTKELWLAVGICIGLPVAIFSLFYSWAAITF